MQPLRISYSSVQAFLRCPRYWYLRYVLGVSAVGEPPRAPAFGTAFHEALSELWTTHGSDQVRLRAALTVWAASATGLTWEDNLIGQQLLVGYCVRYNDAGLKAVTLPISERKLELPLYDPEGNADPRLVFVAVMDKVCYDPDGNTVLIDHKTTTSDLQAEAFWGRFSRSSQITGYMLAADMCGRRPSSFIIDAIKAPNLRQRMATPPEKQEFYVRDSKHGSIGDPKPGTRLEDESRAEFAARVADDIAGNPDKYYGRQVYTKTDLELKAAADDLWYVGQMMLHTVAVGAAPRNEDGCHKFNSVCEYIPACFMGQLGSERLYRITGRT